MIRERRGAAPEAGAAWDKGASLSARLAEVYGVSVSKATIPLLRRPKSPITRAHRRTRGIPNPIQEMISRWISLLPPPKVKITADR